MSDDQGKNPFEASPQGGNPFSGDAPPPAPETPQPVQEAVATPVPPQPAPEPTQEAPQPAPEPTQEAPQPAPKGESPSSPPVVVENAVQVAGDIPTVDIPTEGDDDGVVDVNMGDDIDLGRIEKFQLAKGETARISFLLFAANGMPQLKSSMVFYDDVSRKLFCCPKNKDLVKKVTKKIGKSPSPRFGTIVAVYYTDKNGTPIAPPQGGKLVQYRAFVFSSDKFEPLKTLHTQWDLKKVDIMVNCTEADFQKFNFSPCPEKLITAHLPADKIREIVEEAAELYQEKLPDKMGRVFSDQEIMEFMGFVEGSPQTPASGGQAPVNPFATQVGGTAAGATEDFSDQVAKQTQQGS